MLAPAVTAVIEYFGWDRCAIIATPEDLQTSVALATKQRLESAGILVYYHVINEMRFGDEVSQLMLNTKNNIIF